MKEKNSFCTVSHCSYEARQKLHSSFAGTIPQGYGVRRRVIGISEASEEML